MGKIPQIPEGLKTALTQGKCVLFAGAGLSVAAGYPSWSDLLQELNKRGEQKGYIADRKAKELV